MSAPDAPHIQSLIGERLSRRGFLGGLAALPVLSLAPGARAQGTAAAAPLGFAPVGETRADAVTLPEGYDWQRLISWGDPLFADTAPVNLDNGGRTLFPFTRGEQERRFGTHNDMLALFPQQWTWPWPTGPQSRMILCANHESVSPFGTVPPLPSGRWQATAPQVEAMLACMGVSVVQIAQDGEGRWSPVLDPAPGTGLNRRITPFSEVVFDGPAARHPWVRAAAERVNTLEAMRGNAPARRDGVMCGTLENCAGGYTPWGTYLTAEENINNRFFTSDPASPPLVEALRQPARVADQASLGYSDGWWPGGPDQFDLSRSPHGPALYGWIVEIDPYDPDWTPRKRTALGRRKSECATTVLTADGRVAVYSGDDQVNEFVYKFVSERRFDPRSRTANRDLLSRGTLHVARFEADGTGRWLPVTLEAARAAAPEAAFADAGDLMVRARIAARALGATPMDRPEDVEAPHDAAFRGTGAVYVMATGNTSDAGRPGNAANPRRQGPDGAPSRNVTGHIIRMDEAGGDHGAATFVWDIFAVGGDPSAALVPAPHESGEVRNISSWRDGVATTSGDRFARPDNVCFDGRGHAWVTTDGIPDAFDCNDGLYVLPLEGDGPRAVRRFMNVPVGAEATGPIFTPDLSALFVAIQHPGSSSVSGQNYRGGPDGPFSRFPDGGWARDSVIVVRRRDGGPVGT